MRYLLLVMISLLVGSAGIVSIPPVDRDEARYVQATKQMVETGDYVDIRFQDQSRYKKPIGIYWLQSAAVHIAGDGAGSAIWVYRLVSVLGAALAVLATCWIGSMLFGPAAGLFAGLAVAMLFGLVFEAHIAKTDAMLVAVIVFAQGALAQIYLAARKQIATAAPIVWLFWLAQGIGVLIKGPIAPLASGLTILALVVMDRQWRWLKHLRPLAGLALVTMIALPWLVLITVESGGAFWRESVGEDLFGKVAGGAESHGAPPGYYALTYGLFAWPFGFLMLAAGLAALPRVGEDARLGFLLCWYVPFWLFFELVPTKLPHYVLPAYPALALFLGWALSRRERLEPAGFSGWRRALLYLAGFGHWVVTVALAALAVAAPIHLGDGIEPVAVLAALAIVTTGVLGAPFLPVLQVTAAPARIGAAVAAGMLAYGLMFAVVVPSLERLWLAPRIAEVFAQTRPCERSVLAAVRYHEPSLVFLVGTDTLLTDVAGAAEHLAADPACAMAILPEEAMAMLEAMLSNQAGALDHLAAIGGINYSKGQALSLRMVRMAVAD